MGQHITWIASDFRIHGHLPTKEEELEAKLQVINVINVPLYVRLCSYSQSNKSNARKDCTSWLP